MGPQLLQPNPAATLPVEYDILYGEAAAAARFHAVGTEDEPNILVRQGKIGEGVAEDMGEGGWTAQAVFKLKRTDEDRAQNSAIDDCKLQ